MIERYATPEIGALFAPAATFARWTAIELAVVEAWAARGEVPAADLRALRARMRAPDPARVREIERVTNHDVVAFVRALGERVGEPRARHIHRGLTSSDVVDTALAMGMRDGLAILEAALAALRAALAARAEEHRTTPCAGRTHGMQAEPISFGVRLAGFVAECDRGLARLARARAVISFGKLSGAVGAFTQPPIDPAFEAEVLARLGLEPEPLATQVIPRDRHAEVLATLALVGAGLERLAVELRHLQRSEVAEAREPFGEGATGSSAMPHKRNPVGCERLTGLARLLRGYAQTALEDVALWHERDISHSSAERVIVPDAFHVLHFMLREAARIVHGLEIDAARMRANLDAGKGLPFSQAALGVLLDAGMTRTRAYEAVQGAAKKVWRGQSPDLARALADDPDAVLAAGREALAGAFDLDRYMAHVDTLFARVGLGRKGNRARTRARRRPVGR